MGFWAWLFGPGKNETGINPETGKYYAGSLQRQAELDSKTPQQLEIILKSDIHKFNAGSDLYKRHADIAWQEAKDYELSGNKAQARASVRKYEKLKQTAETFSILAAKGIESLTDLVEANAGKAVAETLDIYVVLQNKYGQSAEKARAAAEALREAAFQKESGAARNWLDAQTILREEVSVATEGVDAAYARMQAEIRAAQQKQPAPQRVDVLKQPAQPARDILPDKGRRDVEKI